MIHEYSVAMLRRLVEFKVSDASEPAKDLLAMLLDGQDEYNAELVDRMLFDGKATSLSTRDRKKLVARIVQDLFAWTGGEDAASGCEGVSSVMVIRDHAGLEDDTIKRILQRRKAAVAEKVRLHKRVMRAAQKKQLRRHPDTELQCHNGGTTHLDAGAACGETGCYATHVGEENSTGGDTQTHAETLLKFLTVEPRRERAESQEYKFQPVPRLAPRRVQNTVRKREDIVRPRRITYIKFSERVKPSLYRIVEEKLFVRNSIRKIPYVLDYEYDSDLEWEDCEDAEDVESTSESEEVEDGDELDFIDADSDSDTDKKFRHPSISFPVLTVGILYDYRPFLGAPLLQHTSVPDGLIPQLEHEVRGCTNTRSLMTSFASAHHIKPRAVHKKIKEMLKNTGNVT